MLVGVFTNLAVAGKAIGLTGSDILKALAGKKVSSILTGDVNYDVDGFDFPFEIKIPNVTVGASTLKIEPHLYDKVVGATVDARP